MNKTINRINIVHKKRLENFLQGAGRTMSLAPPVEDITFFMGSEGELCVNRNARVLLSNAAEKVGRAWTLTSEALGKSIVQSLLEKGRKVDSTLVSIVVHGKNYTIMIEVIETPAGRMMRVIPPFKEP